MSRWLDDMRTARRGQADLLRARAEVPGFAAVEAAIPVWRARLAGLWRDYTTRISSPEMAVSLEVAALLGAAVAVKKPARVLDLGSGFSSYVLRTAVAANGRGTVKSVDDDDAWLEKTRAYLSAGNVTTDDVVGITALGDADRGAYDLVFHDVGSMATRSRLLTNALDCATNTGWVLLDDCHKPRYRATVEREIERRSVPSFSLRGVACDRFKRFDILVVRDLSAS